MLRLFSIIYNKIFGWKVKGEVPKDIKKAIFVVAPHTSNWDFIIGLGVRTTKNFQARFLAKKELFIFPFGYLFRSLGGYPVNRKGNQKMVDRVVEIFDEHDKFMVAITPEGTRSRVDKFKTGFYHIAHKAKAALILTKFDYLTRTVTFSKPMTVSGNKDEDMNIILSYFEGAQGKIPENGIDHLIPKT